MNCVFLVHTKQVRMGAKCSLEKNTTQGDPSVSRKINCYVVMMNSHLLSVVNFVADWCKDIKTLMHLCEVDIIKVSLSLSLRINIKLD